MIEVEIEEAAWSAALPDPERLVTRAAQAVFIRLASPNPQGAEVVVLLTNNARVKDLNARFRGKNVSTNVLSFPAPTTARPHLGDVVLAYGVCAREAEVQGKPLAHHLIHLTAHGVLHLLGYDHASNADAEVMEGLERDILADLDVPDPYARDGRAPHEPDVSF